MTQAPAGAAKDSPRRRGGPPAERSGESAAPKRAPDPSGAFRVPRSIAFGERFRRGLRRKIPAVFTGPAAAGIFYRPLPAGKMAAAFTGRRRRSSELFDGRWRRLRWPAIGRVGPGRARMRRAGPSFRVLRRAPAAGVSDQRVPLSSPPPSQRVGEGEREGGGSLTRGGGRGGEREGGSNQSLTAPLPSPSQCGGGDGG